MDQSFLAFRCVGDFAWPPVTKAPKTVPLSFLPGVVEVHYVKSNTGSWIGCVRWIGKSQFSQTEIDSGNLWKPLSKPLAEIRELRKLSDAALAKEFLTHGGSTDPKNSELTFRFDASVATNHPNGRLRFEGAHLLEQFGAPSEKELEERAAELEAGGVVTPPALKLRLPLVRKPYSEVTEQGTRDWYSSLQIGTDDHGDRVRLDIAVPLPLPGSSRQWSAGRAICAFGAIFDGSPDAAEVATWKEGARFDTMTYGLRSRDVPVTANSLANWMGDCEISLQMVTKPAMVPSIEDVIERMLPASGISIVSKKGQDATQGFTLASVGGMSLRPLQTALKNGPDSHCTVSGASLNFR